MFIFIFLNALIAGKLASKICFVTEVYTRFGCESFIAKIKKKHLALAKNMYSLLSHIWYHQYSVKFQI